MTLFQFPHERLYLRLDQSVAFRL